MNKNQDNKLNSFTLDLNNHSPEGVDILASEPSNLISTTLYLLIALLTTALLWSFLGKSDVIISTRGIMKPDAKIQRVYSPLNGELIEIYFTEGMPVQEDDVLARIHAVKAIQFTDAFLNAKLALANKEKEYAMFPAKKKLMEQKAESMKRRYEALQSVLDKRVETSLTRLAEKQKLSIKKERTELRKLAVELNQARNELAKYERLHKLPAGGGISKQQLTQKRNVYKKAQVNFELAENEISELEIKFTTEFNKEKETLMQGQVQTLESRLEYENELQNIVREELKIKQGMRTAKLQLESASRVRLENIDENGFLKILSPYSGIITDAPYNQQGDKIESKSPLASIAPEGSKIMLEIEIPESRRGLIKAGLPVKIKVSAFAYQRFGFLNGILEYVSPTTRVSVKTKQPVYKGRVRMDKTVFTSNGIEYPVRYGMTAIAEIIVRQRRVIDAVLDPLRGMTD